MINHSDILIIDPAGIDRAIQDLQVYIQNNLSWVDNAYDYNVFGNDESQAFCFFSLNSDVEVETSQTGKTIQHNASVSLIFFVDLSKTHTLQHRADENAIVDVEKIVSNYSNEFSNWNLRKIIRTVDSVYNRYDFTNIDARIDNEPYTVFSFEFDMKYNNNQIC